MALPIMLSRGEAGSQTRAWQPPSPQPGIGLNRMRRSDSRAGYMADEYMEHLLDSVMNSIESRVVRQKCSRRHGTMSVRQHEHELFIE